MTNLFTERLQEHQQMMQALAEQSDLFDQIAAKTVESIKAGGKICFMGNGGSAADSQHLAAELVGRFQMNRPGMASIAFTTDTSILTAVANDYGYDAIFARQVEGLCRPEDVVVGLSTSGNSPNVVKGIEKAREMGVFTVGLTGGTGGKLMEAADLCLVVPESKAARIQEAHIFIGHSLCEVIELEASESGSE